MTTSSTRIALATALCWMVTAPAAAAEMAAAAPEDEQIVVTGTLETPSAGTKTATPLIETPQPISIIPAETYLEQGAINISDTVRYTAGVTAGAYGRDTRVDSFVIRGIDALQFRDGMRDIFSFYASITADPYNFSRVEVVRGPASVLFGQGSIGGLVNLVSKMPTLEDRGEINAVYGSWDRKELLGDVDLRLADGVGARLVARVRDADTQVRFVPDDRIMLAPSFRFQPTPDTDITLLGLYQEDDGGSTQQFLPVVGTLLPNGTNPRLDRNLFVGRPGGDRYDGRLLQGSALLTHRFGDAVQLSLKARYIDSDLDYVTHYTNSYSDLVDPTNTAFPRQPYLDAARRIIGLYAESSQARLNIFSTDNNLTVRFNTGAAVEHVLLAGLDYSWNEVRKRGGFGYQEIDLYDIDYDAVQVAPIAGPFARESQQKQLGLYLQDQVRFWDRVSVVLGVRRDHVRTGATLAAESREDEATTFRAGIIGELGAGLSPFFSYTESFLPIGGANAAGQPFRPQTGAQYEAGVKWQPDANTLVTVTGFRIKESGRPIGDPANPLERVQSGSLKTRGIEFEGIRTLPDNYELRVNYGYNKLSSVDSLDPTVPRFSDYLPRHNASIWGTKTLSVGSEATLRLGAGVRYTGASLSQTALWTIRTPDYTLVDALVALEWSCWRAAVNATNLFGNAFYGKCLARGDCFQGQDRNVMGSLAYRF